MGAFEWVGVIVSLGAGMATISVNIVFIVSHVAIIVCTIVNVRVCVSTTEWDYFYVRVITRANETQ